MTAFDDQLGVKLQQRREQLLYRTRPQLTSAQAVNLQVDGRDYIGFSSNDYLGLANHPEVNASFKRAVDEFGTGSGASHLVCGHSRHHHALEEELAAFTGRPRALLFSSGYMANLGIIDALLGRGDWLFQDRLNHASLIDASRLTSAKVRRFRANNLELLGRELSGNDNGQKLIATDGVFSMDGHLAELPSLAKMATANNACLMVDDAHGFGVLGKTGGGCAEHFGLDIEQLPVLMGTLGKAFGSFGAFVAGSENLIEYLIQFSRTYIYTTALPPAVAAATRTSLQLLQQESWRREKLNALINRFKRGIAALGLDNLDSPTPIQPIILADEARTMKIAALLRDRGFLVGAIRPPTVPRGTARLRVTLCANHSEQHIDDLVSAIGESVHASGNNP